MRGVGRPERKLDTSKPLHAFAAELRELRAKAGNPKYLVMARVVGVSQAALQNAAGGDHNPTWRTVEGYVRACKGDLLAWRKRWESLQDQLKAAAESINGTVPMADTVEVTEPSDDRTRSWRSRWLWPAMATLLVVITAITVRLVDVLTAQVHTSGKAASVLSAVAPIIVQNRVALGADALLEDSTPAYLSSQPVPYCSKNGCMVPATTLSSDTAVIADCQVMGAMMYNYNLDSPLALNNPNRAASKLWYHIVLRSGASGFLSEVYVEPKYRGGLGLPKCSGATVATPSPI